MLAKLRGGIAGLRQRDLVARIGEFITDGLISDEGDDDLTIDVVMAMVECAGLVLSAARPDAATSKGNHLFDLLCDHFAAAIAHYAGGGTTDHDDWLRSENDDESRFRDPRSLGSA